MPFLDHLEELRWRILWSLLAIIAGSIAGFFVVTRLHVMEWLIEPLRPFLPPGGKLTVFGPLDSFFITLQLTLTVGLILAFPVVAYQIWAFISPALHKREKRAIVPALYLGLLLFAGGVALAYYLVLPMTLKFGSAFLTESLQVNYVANAYLGLVVKLLVAFGAVFELPVVIMVLSSLGLVSSRFLADKRRYAVAGSAVLAALLTPGDAISATLFMMGPIVLLYELSIVLARIIERRKLRAETSEPYGIATALLILALSASGVQAQQPQQQQPPKKTPQELVKEKLRAMGREAARDTTALPDSVVQRMRQDSIARERRRTATPPEMGTDSIMRALQELEGFTATQYRAITARFNADTGVLVLTAKPDAKAVVVQGTQSMTADSLLVFNRNTSIACGYGKPVLTGEGAEAPVESQRVCYNTQTRMGTALGATTRITEGASWVVTGDLTTVERDVYGHRTRFTDCTLEVPHYHFAAGKIKVIGGDVLVARDVTLQFGDVPVFWLPFMMQSMKRGRASGILMPRFSVNDIVRRNSRYNRRIENVGFYWATSDNMGAELTLDWFANNWTALNGSIDYRFNDKFLDGRVTYRRFWKSEGGREFTLAANNSWQPDERTNLAANLQYSTSSTFIRDRSYDPRELNRSIDSNAGLNRRFDWGSLSFQASRRQFLTDNKVDMTLPSLGLNLASITLFPTAGEGRFYNNATWTGSTQVRFTTSQFDQALTPSQRDRDDIQANASSSFSMGSFSWSQAFDMRKAKQHELQASGDSVQASPEIKDERMNWNTSINYQQRLIGTTTFTPGLSLRGETGRDSLGRMISAPMRLDFNASVKADLFGFFPGAGPIERIRHRISPSLTYTYSPEVSPDSAQKALFGGAAVLERNSISFGIAQTFEAKRRVEERDPTADTTEVADTAVNDPDQPRRIQRAPTLTLLSLFTDAIVYDFVEAREGRHGIQTTQISNSIQSDLLRGLQLSVTHDLFRAVPTEGGGPLGTPDPTAQADREFSPFLSRVNASFSLSGNSWLFRMLGLAGSDREDNPPAAGSTPTPVPQAADAGPRTDPSRPELGLLGTRNRPTEPQQQSRGAVGSWNASFNYTLFRQREDETTSRLGTSQNNQMVTANVTFQPTQMWNVAWNTGYSFTEKAFTDHVLTLTRAMHDWDANFDFIKAQNGNFSFQFRVALRANPDIKFDYEQRDRNRQPTFR